MDNTFVFSDAAGYDMVVAVTEKTINDQIATLASPDVGIIKTEFVESWHIYAFQKADGRRIIVQMGADPKQHDKYVPMLVDDWNKVPKDVNGLPVNVCMRASYMPSISITSSGVEAALVLNFTGGDFYMRDFGSGNILDGVDMSGWAFGIVMNLDFAEIERHPNAPKFVIDQLNHFTSDMFRVSQLFLNFERSELTRFEPSITSVGANDDSVKLQFVYLMTSWLKYFQANAAENPFILGYTITRTDKTNDADMGVPDSLKPIGNTFNVYKDAVEDRSTLNFVLNTNRPGKSSKEGQHASPGNFNSNWIGPKEDCRAKMIYSCGAFLEDLILEPFYNKYSASFRDQLKDQLNLDPETPYEKAKSTGATRSLSYAVHNQENDDDQYRNYLNVSWAPLPGTNGVSITWNGSWHFRKSKSTNLGIATARAWGQVESKWTATMTVAAALDDQKRPVLKTTSPQVQVTSWDTDHWLNDAAKVAKVFADIISIATEIVTAFQAGNFQNFFENLFGGSGPDIHAIDVASIQLGNSINAAFLLPAGDVFDFKNFSMLDTGESCLQLTYKAETGGSTVTPSQKVMMNGVDLPSTAPRGKLLASGPSQTLAAPLTDKLQLQPLQATITGTPAPIDLTVSCELMQNTGPGMPVSIAADLNIVQDSKGNAHLLSIGSDGAFNLLVATSGETASGWSVSNLTAPYPQHSKCLAFDVYQDQQGHVSLAFALKRISGTVSDVFFATNLSSKDLTNSLTNIQAFAKPISGIDLTFIPEQIRFGPTDDGKAPMLSIVGSLGFDHMWYQINSGSTTVTPMQFPENVDQGGSNIVTQRSGFMLGQRANHFLYNFSGTRRLVVQAVSSDGSAGNLFDYSPGNTDLPSKFRDLTYNTIEVVTSRPDPTSPASDLYIGSSTGLYRIPNGKHALMEAVTESVKDIHMVSVVAHGDNISVWALAAGNLLYYIYGQRQRTTPASTSITWNAAILFATGIVSLAAIRSVSNTSNEVFLLTEDSSILHYWQDSNSTLWQSRTASVPHSKYVVNFESFTTHVHLESQGMPLAKTPLRVTCSEWQYYTINGLLYSLDQDVAAQVDTDDFGNLTMINAAQGIATHVLHLQSDSFAETINIYPGGKIQYHLHNIKNGQDLRDAKQQDGNPVVDPSTTTNVSDGVAAHITTLHGAASDNYPPSKAGNVFTVAEHPASPTNPTTPNLKHTMSERIVLPSLPTGTAVGASVMNGDLEPLSSNAVHALLHNSKALKFSFNPVDIAGDVLHGIESVGGSILGGIKDGLVQLDNGIHFVITKAEEGLTLVLSLVDKVVTIALKSLVLVYKALNYILKLVGIDLTKLMRWLGHLLGWDEIWDTHKAIAGFLKNAVDYAANNGMRYIDVAKSTIDSVLDGFDDTIKQALLPDDAAKNNLVQNKQNVQDEGTLDMNNPQMNFTAYHLNQSTTEPSAQAATASSPQLTLTSIYDQLIAPLATTFLDKMGRNAGDLVNLFTHGSIEDIKRLLFDVVDTVVALVKQFIDGLLGLAKDVVGTIQNLLDEDLDIPIIGAIYDFVTALFGEEESFSIINGISFIIAIVITVVTKCAGLGAFAATEAVQTVSGAGGISWLVGRATTKAPQLRSKMAIHPVNDGQIRTLTVVPAPQPKVATTEASSKDVAAAAALTVVAMSATAVNSVLIPSAKNNIQAFLSVFQQFCSIPWWQKAIGKSDLVVGFRWTRWVFAFIGAGVLATAKSATPKQRAIVAASFAAINTLFTVIVDAIDSPQGSLKEEGFASDYLLNCGGLARAGGQYLIATGNPLEGAPTLGIGVASLMAGSGMGLHIAIKNYQDKEQTSSFEGFLAAALSTPPLG